MASKVRPPACPPPFYPINDVSKKAKEVDLARQENRKMPSNSSPPPPDPDEEYYACPPDPPPPDPDEDYVRPFNVVLKKPKEVDLARQGNGSKPAEEGQKPKKKSNHAKTEDNSVKPTASTSRGGLPLRGGKAQHKK
jgi:hypothetical protein